MLVSPLLQFTKQTMKDTMQKQVNHNKGKQRNKVIHKNKQSKVTRDKTATVKNSQGTALEERLEETHTREDLSHRSLWQTELKAAWSAAPVHRRNSSSHRQ